MRLENGSASGRKSPPWSFGRWAHRPSTSNTPLFSLLSPWPPATVIEIDQQWLKNHPYVAKVADRRQPRTSINEIFGESTNPLLVNIIITAKEIDEDTGPATAKQRKQDRVSEFPLRPLHRRVS